jgi:O6-methylguanine-DNA--protein-cysteine methyltransferase
MITTLRETSAQNTAIQTITFRVGTCTLGLVLVATTPQGICAILLGSDEKALVGQLRSIFPQATLQKDGKELDEVLNRVVQVIETPTATLALLLDIGGTAFQKRVWKALREIPAGQTATYKELALKLGATLPTAEHDLRLHYTFSENDLSIIRSKRGPHNRLGLLFSFVICA